MGVLLSELLIPGWANEGKLAMTIFAEGNLPCHNVDPDIYFSESKPDIQYAKALCSTCPMREQCLQGAMERFEPCGVWGGELFNEGKVILEKRSPGRPRLDRSNKEPVVAMTNLSNFPTAVLRSENDALEMVG